MMNDYEIIDFLEMKIEETRGEKQEEWIRKYDIFTSRYLFEKYNRTEDLKKVEKIRMEMVDYE